MPPSDFLADFTDRARARLLPAPPDWRGRTAFHRFGDEVVAGNRMAVIEGGAGTPAAVLIPVVAHEPEATLLLTRRAGSLRNHSGQVAFPGGRIDPGDDGPLGAALREAQEEVGLDAGHVEPLGYLDLYLTTSGFSVAPVVALVRPGFALTLNPREVDAAFECPLAFVMDPANHRRESREWRGAMRSYYAMPFGEHYIWGVTAGILRLLYERLYQ